MRAVLVLGLAALSVAARADEAPATSPLTDIVIGEPHDVYGALGLDFPN